MLKHKFDLICKQLGFLYTQSFSSEGLTDQIPDDAEIEIDSDAFSAGEERCFVIQKTKRVQTKKSLILTSWYLNSLDEKTYSSILSFLEQLMDEGYKIYISGADKLELIEDSSLLHRHILNMTPVSAELAIKWAAAQKMSRDSVDVINTHRLLTIARSLEQLNNESGSSRQIEDKSDYFYPLVPLSQNPDIFLEEQSDGATEEFALNYNREIAVPAPFVDKVRSLTIRGLISDEDIDYICTQFNSLNELIVAHSNINANQLDQLLNANKELSKLVIYDSKTLDTGLLTLDADALVLLSELVISKVGSFSPFILKTLLIQAQQVTRLKLHSCTLMQPGDDFWEEPQSLLKLDEFICTQFMAADSSANPFIITLTLNASVVTLSEDIMYEAEQYTKAYSLNTTGNQYFNDPQRFLKLAQRPNVYMKSNPEWASFLNHAAIQAQNQAIQIDGYLNEIKELSLFDCLIAEKNLVTILRMTPKIQSLDLSDCRDFVLEQTDLFIPNLPELRILRACKSTLKSNQLSAILDKTPHLALLDLSGCEGIRICDLRLKPGQLSELTELNLYGNQYHAIDITAKECSMLFCAAPNIRSLTVFGHFLRTVDFPSCLRELKISNIDIAVANHILKTLPLLTQLKINIYPSDQMLNGDDIQLPHLKELHCSGMNLDYSKIIFNAPNLIKLNLSDNRMQPMLENSVALSPSPCLQSLELNNILVDFNSCSNLKSLTIKRNEACFTDINAITAGCLSQLKTLHLNITSLQSHHVQKLLLGGPNIQALTVTGGFQKVSDESISISQLPFLTNLCFERSYINEDLLIQLVRIAPGLQKIVLVGCLLINTDCLLRLKKQFPDIEFEEHQIKGISPIASSSFSSVTTTRQQSAATSRSSPGMVDTTTKLPPTITEQQSAATSRSSPGVVDTTTKSPVYKDVLQPDGLLKNDPNKALYFDRIFKRASGKHPSPNGDHCNLFTYDKTSAVYKRYKPLLSDLEPYDYKLQSKEEIEQDFWNAERQATEQELLLAQPPLFHIKHASEWILLPGRSTIDKLLALSTEPPVGGEVRRSRKTGLYFFHPGKAFIGPIRIQYTIQSGETENKASLVHDDPLQAHIAALSFDSKEQLDTASSAYQALILEPPSVRIDALRRFCTFEEESAADFQGTRPELLNHLLRHRAGACRHRSDLFMRLTEQLGIEAYRVDNQVHDFTLVSDEHKEPYTVQLGGAAAHLKEYAAQEELIKPQVLPSSNKPDKSNPFRSWKLTPLKARNAFALVDELRARGETKKRQLILTKSQQTLDELHKAVLHEAHSDECFFSANLDSLALHSNYIASGQRVKMDSPELAFLKRAKEHPEKLYTWFINWSNPQAEHTSYNAIIDNDDRQLKGHPLPPNVATVLVMDELSALGMGKDFYSRMELRSQAPELSSPPEPEAEYAVIEEQDVLLCSPYHWKKNILGHISMEHGQLSLMQGGLLKAMKRAQSGAPIILTIHNAPSELDAFRWFKDELNEARRFYFNGMEHQLPDNLRIKFVHPIYNFSAFTDCLINTEILSEERVLNTATWSSFFPGQRIGAQGIELALGQLEQASGSSLSLIVSESLNEAQWYLLLNEARKHQVKLSLKCLTGITLPDASLHAKVQHYTFSQPSAPIKWVVSADIDFASEQEQARHTIPIGQNTSFESLFFKIHRGKNADGSASFWGEKTDLLRAVERGESIVLKGQFSESLIKKVHSLLVQPGYLLVNGERITVRGPISLVSSGDAFFGDMPYVEVPYFLDDDFALLDPSQADYLDECYYRLKIVPKHSHFRMFLDVNQEQREQLFQQLIQQLHVSVGQSEPIRAPVASSSSEPLIRPTQPEEVLEQLERHPFLFLNSESGAGKSYFMHYRLPEYGKQTGKPIKVFNELRDLGAWASCNEQGKKILFIDEANISTESYHYFDNLARGERVIWINGMRHELSPDHHVVFAGNPLRYGNRLEADLFKRFPNYMTFHGEPLDSILEPMALLFGIQWSELSSLIEFWYKKAQGTGLNITPRNAEMMCLSAFIMQLSMPDMPPRVLMSYAILNQLKTLHADKKSGRGLRKELRQNEWGEQREELKHRFFQQAPQAANDEFIWTKSRQKIAGMMHHALHVRAGKINHAASMDGVFTQAQGINGFVIEGEQGLGKTQLISAVLKQAGLKPDSDFEIIQLGKPDTRQKLYEAFHAGRIVIIDEFNTFPDEQLMNDYLSGYDEFKQSAHQPGFFVFGAQNPITFQNRVPLSKAQENRLQTVTLPDYTKEELRTILVHKFNKLPEELIDLRIDQYLQAKHYAERQRLSPVPDTRTLMAQVSLDEQEHNDGSRPSMSS